MIATRDLCKRFGSLTVLDKVSVDIEAREVVCLVGPSGSGKSTLLRCLNLLETPDSGELLWEGESVDYRGLGETELSAHRRRMGMVFQHFNLFGHLTVVANVMEGPVQVLGLPRDQARERAIGLLGRVGLSDKADEWPDRLSGGQKQRVAIARALAMEPAALLLDEVTSALDVEMISGVNDLLTELAQEMTMVVVTHDLSFARSVCHRVLFFDAGQVVETGPPEQVLVEPTSDRARKFLAAVHG